MYKQFSIMITYEKEYVGGPMVYKIYAPPTAHREDEVCSSPDFEIALQEVENMFRERFNVPGAKEIAESLGKDLDKAIEDNQQGNDWDAARGYG
jgi:hypothetical protein